MDWTGKTLGHYEIIAKIGAGGMATVYRAKQPSLGREVAVKVLSDELARDPEFRERFLREARAVAQLTHPHILPVYDFGEETETHTLYFVTQYVEGGSLAQRLESGPLPVEDAARIGAQVARALDFAHRRGVIHRDVKPANILLTADGHPLLADFGIARVLQETHLTQTGMTLGTPAYMSPEHARGEEINHCADIYALGVVIYEMLAGRAPFKGDTPIGLLHQHAFMPPPSLTAARPDLPKALERVVMRALAKFPAERYASAAEFSEALDTALTARQPFFKLRRTEGVRRTENVRHAKNASPPVEVTTAVLPPSQTPPASTPPEQLPPVPAPVGAPVTPPKPAPYFSTGAEPKSVRIRRGAKRAGKWLVRALTITVIVLVALAALILIGGTVILGNLIENGLARFDWQLDTVDTRILYTYRTDRFVGDFRAAIEPYALDALNDLWVTFSSPDTVTFTVVLNHKVFRLQIGIGEEAGIPQVQFEQLNGVPLYIIGGILSERANRGIMRAWDKAPVRVDSFRLSPTSFEVRYRKR
ncbi:MAG: serine/threonine protein kinase [Anaerolineae bacterium]|nr:serine/threonine protein kinase [Anaerolineae bacterium]